MTAHEPSVWLTDAQRFTVPPLRHSTIWISGASLVVWHQAIARGVWRVAVQTAAPGHGTWSAELPADRQFANADNAIAGGLAVVREHWRRANVPGMVDCVQRVMDALWLDVSEET